MRAVCAHRRRGRQMNALVLLGLLVSGWAVAQTTLFRKAMRPPGDSRVRLGRTVLLVVARFVATVAVWFLASVRWEDVAGPLGLLAVAVAIDVAFALLLISRAAG